MNDAVRRRSWTAGAVVLVLAVAVLAGCSSGGGSDTSSVAGSYLNKKKGAIVLSADGRFSIVQANRTAASGTYTVDGTTITFFFGSTKAGTGKIEGDKLTDPDGNVFVRVAAAPSVSTS